MKYTNEQKARLFDALHADGVDNWEGYQQENYQEAEEEIEAEAMFDKVHAELDELLEIFCESAEVDYPAGQDEGYNITIPMDGQKDIVKFIIKKYKQGND